MQNYSDSQGSNLKKIVFQNTSAMLFARILGLFFSLCGVIVSQASNSPGLIIITIVVLASLFLGKKISSVVVDG